MGLWGSKQSRELKVPNPEAPTQVFVTENAITNVVKTVNESKQSKEPEQQKVEEAPKQEVSLRLLPDLHDKRINEYEKSLISGLNEASREVENLFRERYTTFPVCLDLQNKVSQCYSDNPTKTLNCLDITNNFIKCVEQERQNKFGLLNSNRPFSKNS